MLDPFVQFVINVFVALIGIGVGALMAIWIYLAGLTRRELIYQVVSDAPSINDSV